MATQEPEQIKKRKRNIAANPRNAVTLYLDAEDRTLLDSIVIKSGDGLKKNAIYMRVFRKGMKEETRPRSK